MSGEGSKRPNSSRGTWARSAVFIGAGFVERTARSPASKRSRANPVRGINADGTWRTQASNAAPEKAEPREGPRPEVGRSMLLRIHETLAGIGHRCLKQGPCHSPCTARNHAEDDRVLDVEMEPTRAVLASTRRFRTICAIWMTRLSFRNRIGRSGAESARSRDSFRKRSAAESRMLHYGNTGGWSSSRAPDPRADGQGQVADP